MARLARVVAPDYPHHVTQRGNGRQKVFFEPGDYALYRDLLAASCAAADVAIWSWCLMPNHVHLILVPSDADGLRRALTPVHRRYAGIIHARRRRTGHFWQGRFGAVALDQDHLAAALRYVALNPVRARLVKRAQDWRWSSTHALISGRADAVTTVKPVRDMYPRFAELLVRNYGDSALNLKPRRQRAKLPDVLSDAARTPDAPASQAAEARTEAEGRGIK